MTHRERFLATLDRRVVDRPASWLGLPTPEAEKKLFEYFRVTTMPALKRVLDDDVYPVEVPFDNPPSNHVACAFNFAKDTGNTYEERSLTVPGFFEDHTDPATVEDFDWPDPTDHMSAEACRLAVADIPEDYAVMGILWSAHFQDACSAFGMENALMTLLETPEMFQAVIDRIVEFYLQANRTFYEGTRGRLDAVLIGNDFGSQTGLMLHPDLLREYVFSGTRRLVEQAKSYGVRVVHHSCGAVAEVIPDLIELGVDCIHPIQALAEGMQPKLLRDAFGGRTAFCGGIDAQHLLVNGTADEIRNKVRELAGLFPTGLVISPSHEAILPDVDPANIEAIFAALKR